MLYIDNLPVSDTEWLTPANGKQPSLHSHSGLYAMREGFVGTNDGCTWACANIVEALESIKERVEEGYGCGPDSFSGAIYTVYEKNLYITSSDKEAFIEMVAS